jgi:hypothetical protein
MMFPMNNELNVFLERLIEEKGFENLSEKLKADILEGLNKRLMAYIITGIAKNLTAEQAEKMNRMIEDGKEHSLDQIQKFLGENVSNIDEIVAQAMMDFREVYLKS